MLATVRSAIAFLYYASVPHVSGRVCRVSHVRNTWATNLAIALPRDHAGTGRLL